MNLQASLLSRPTSLSVRPVRFDSPSHQSSQVGCGAAPPDLQYRGGRYLRRHVSTPPTPACERRRPPPARQAAPQGHKRLQFPGLTDSLPSRRVASRPPLDCALTHARPALTSSWPLCQSILATNHVLCSPQRPKYLAPRAAHARLDADLTIPHLASLPLPDTAPPSCWLGQVPLPTLLHPRTVLPAACIASFFGVFSSSLAVSLQAKAPVSTPRGASI